MKRSLLTSDMNDVIAAAITDCNFVKPFDVALFIAVRLDQAGYRITRKPRGKEAL